MTSHLYAITASSWPQADAPVSNQALPRSLSGAPGKLADDPFEKIISGRRRIARHASLFVPNERLDLLYAVRFGQFKVFALDPMGQQRVIGFHMAGDLMGLDAIATGRHQFRAVALEDSEVCEIPYADLEAAMSAAPTVQRQFLQLMSQCVVNEGPSATFLSNMRCDQRFGYFLLTLSSRYAALGYSGKSFRLSMSRGDIGSYLGITAESVSRLIARFKRNGWIRVEHRDVEIADREGMQVLFSGDAGARTPHAELQRAASAAATRRSR